MLCLQKKRASASVHSSDMTNASPHPGCAERHPLHPHAMISASLRWWRGAQALCKLPLCPTSLLPNIYRP
eukprot:6179909-Pleurochrysis_carterae.AAC.2